MYPKIFADSLYRSLIAIAQFSGSSSQRYGSAVVQDERILSMSYNHNQNSRMNLLDKIVDESVQVDSYVIGGNGVLGNHSETAAFNHAKNQESLGGVKLVKPTIFVAGYFVKEKKLFLHEEFSCFQCVRTLATYKVGGIGIPTPDGWLVKRPIDWALVAQKYAGDSHNRRIDSLAAKWNVHNLATYMQEKNL